MVMKHWSFNGLGVFVFLLCRTQNTSLHECITVLSPRNRVSNGEVPSLILTFSHYLNASTTLLAAGARTSPDSSTQESSGSRRYATPSRRAGEPYGVEGMLRERAAQAQPRPVQVKTGTGSSQREQ